MRIFHLVLGTIFFLMPIAYTFLHLFGLIGPANDQDAIALGMVLWIIGLVIGFIFIVAGGNKN